MRETLDQARTEDDFMGRWGCRRASLPACQELARLTAYSGEFQAVLP